MSDIMTAAELEAAWDALEAKVAALRWETEQISCDGTRTLPTVEGKPVDSSWRPIPPPPALKQPKQRRKKRRR